MPKKLCAHELYVFVLYSSNIGETGNDTKYYFNELPCAQVGWFVASLQVFAVDDELFAVFLVLLWPLSMAQHHALPVLEALLVN